jgi:FHA domain
MAHERELPAVVSSSSATAWRLRVIDQKGVRVFDQALEPRRYLLGRDAQCELRLPAREVSREHAALECDERGRWWLVDLGSTSGTFVNGRRVEGRAPLSSYDVAYIGEYRLELGSEEGAASRPTLVLPQGRARRAPARVRVYEGRFAGRDLRLDRGRVVFGEGPDSSVPLEGEGNAGVRVVIRPLKEGDYEVVDEGSRPGLTVDGRAAFSYRLGGGDVLLGLGPTERQRANALDAFGLRYLPSERPLDDDDDRLGPDDEPALDEADAELAALPPIALEGTPTPPAPPGFVANLLASQGPWPDIEFGPPVRESMSQTVELRRPANLKPNDDAAIADEAPQTARQPLRALGVGAAVAGAAADGSNAGGAPAESSVAGLAAEGANAEAAWGGDEVPTGPGYLGRTVVRSPRSQEAPAPDAAPVSLTAFVRPLATTLSSTPPSTSAVAARGVDDDEASPLDPLAGAVKRTVRLSELNWPPQREALRARAEAGSRRWWLTAGALALGVLVALVLLLNVWRRESPPPAVAESAAPVAPIASAPPSSVPSAGAEATPSSLPVEEAVPSALPSASVQRPGRGPGGEGVGVKGDDADVQRKRRLQELCKQRLDCSP